MTHDRRGVEHARNRAGAERKAGRAALRLWGRLTEGEDAVQAWTDFRRDLEAAGFTSADAVRALGEARR